MSIRLLITGIFVTILLSSGGCTNVPDEGLEILPGATGRMIYIRGGAFLMGDTYGDGAMDELPAHTVELSGFYLSSCEVTVAEFREFTEETGTAMPPAPSWGWIDDHPLVNVTWHEAVAYCKWLSEKTGMDYRLPTEAEWEYAARNRGKKMYFPVTGDINSGNAKCATYEIWEEDQTLPGTMAAGLLPPNDLGIYNMAGNVHEWVEDFYLADYYSNCPVHNPMGPGVGEFCVERGGSWASPLEFARVANRNYARPDFRAFNIGFRIAMSSN